MDTSENGSMDAGYWVIRSHEALLDHRFGEALEFADRAIEQNPRSIEAWIARSDALIRTFRMPEAESCLLRALTIEPASPMEWYWRCFACLSLQRTEEAAACIRGAERGATSDTIWSMLAELFSRYGMTEPARQCRIRVLRYPGTRPEYLAEEAALFSTTTSRKNPGKAHLLRLLQSAIRCESEGNILQAIALYDEILSQAPHLSSVVSTKGKCFTDLADLPRALECFRDATRMNPFLTAAWTNLGNLLATSGKLEEGMECLDKALELEPERHYILYMKGSLYMEFGIFDKGLEWLKKALAMDPDWADALANRGICEYQLSLYPEAVESLSRAIRFNPELAIAWQFLGNCHHTQGQEEEARSCFSIADSLTRQEARQRREANYRTGGTSGGSGIPTGKDSVNLVDMGVLGCGGFGEVRLGYDPSLQRMVASKTYHEQPGADTYMEHLFRKEADMWIRLGDHPHIVKAFGVVEKAGRLYILMEYIPPDRDGNVSLQDYLGKRSRDPERMLGWAIHICLGMEHAYSKGLTSHRDLKPSNILIGPDGKARVSDFGLAGFAHHKKIPGEDYTHLNPKESLSCISVCGKGMGTITHMAPEQFEDIGLCSERSDIYSFGVILFEMATGTLPFMAHGGRDGSPEEMKRFHEEMHALHQDAPVPKIFSPLYPVIRKCMEKDPSRRYQHFSDVRSALEGLQRTGGMPFSSLDQAHAPRDEAGIPGEMQDSAGTGSLPDTAVHREPSEELRSIIRQGTTLFRLKKYRDALGYFSRAMGIHPGSLDAWRMAAYCHRNLGEFDQALACYERVLAIDERAGSDWFNKGLIHLGLNQPGDAIRCFDRALALEYCPGETSLHKGTCYLMMERKREAVDAFRKAVAADPGLLRAWNFCAFTLSELSRESEAIECFRKALELFPLDTEIWTNLAICQHRIGRLEDALRSLEHAIALDPGYGPAQALKRNIIDTLDREGGRSQ